MSHHRRAGSARRVASTAMRADGDSAELLSRSLMMAVYAAFDTMESDGFSRPRVAPEQIALHVASG